MKLHLLANDARIVRRQLVPGPPGKSTGPRLYKERQIGIFSQWGVFIAFLRKPNGTLANSTG